MFSTRHQPLIDNLGRIIPTRIDVHTFLHDRIGASSQRLPGFVATRLDLRPLRLCSHLLDGLGQVYAFEGGGIGTGVWIVSYRRYAPLVCYGMALLCFASFSHPHSCYLGFRQRDRSDGDHESALTSRASTILGISPLVTIDASEYCFFFFLGGGSIYIQIYSVVVIAFFPFRDS